MEIAVREQSFPAPTVVAVAIVVAALANVAQFPALELETSDVYEAVRIKQGHEPLALVEGHFGSTQERFLLAVQLREYAPDARLTLPVSLPRSDDLTDEQLLGLGLASHVERVDYDPTIAADAATQLDAAITVEGVSGDLGPYALVLPATEDGRGHELLLVEGPARTYVVERGLLEAAIGELPA